MAYELSQEVTAYLTAGGRGETPSERVVLYAIAERARVETRSAWEEPDWHLETIVGAGRLRDVLARLAARGIEVRVAIGVDSRGRKMYAYRGNQRTYRLPLLRPNGAAVPAPSDVPAAPFDSKGAAVPAPSDAVAAPSDAVAAPSDAVAAPSDAVPAPYPYAVSRTPRPPVGAPPPTPSPNGSDGGGGGGGGRSARRSQQPGGGDRGCMATPTRGCAPGRRRGGSTRASDRDGP